MFYFDYYNICVGIMKWKHFWGMFFIGFSDSISLYWLKSILFVKHPVNKNIHPSSLKLLQTFKNTFVQVLFFLIALPQFFYYIGYEYVSYFLSALFLLLTYGYLFFYNNEVMVSTKEVALWSSKFNKCHFPEFDNREKVELFYSLSNQLQGCIFLLLYYLPIFVCLTVLMGYFPVFGSVCIIISESFFNSAFYFLKKWPYDRYNVAFLEHNLPYMLGYGLFVSIVCNWILIGTWARGAYFLISQWMMINCVIFSPPEASLSTWSQVILYIRSHEQRSKLKSQYNVHRERIRSEKQYRKNILSQIFIVTPALKITEVVNNLIAHVIS